MNRYVIGGLAGDAASGKDVIFVGTAAEVKHVLDCVLQVAVGIRKVIRAHGRERIEFESGGRLLFARSETGVRGHDAHVVYISDSKRDDPGLAVSAWVTVNARHGEVIRS